MGTDKALLPWPPGSSDGTTLLSAAILAFRPVTDAVVVVAGNNAGRLGPIADEFGARMVLNPAPERGQFSSLQIGLREVMARGSDAAMITPVDNPPLSPGTLRLLRREFEKALACGQWAVAPQNHGRRGHPLLASRALIDAYLNASATGNARAINHAHAQFFQYVQVDEALLGIDANTPEEYAALSAKAQRPVR